MQKVTIFFLCFFCLTALARTSSVLPNRSANSEHPCTVPHLRGNFSVFDYSIIIQLAWRVFHHHVQSTNMTIRAILHFYYYDFYLAFLFLSFLGFPSLCLHCLSVAGHLSDMLCCNQVKRTVINRPVVMQLQGVVGGEVFYSPMIRFQSLEGLCL